MNQQINLYHPIFRRQEKKFSARAMLQASGLLLAGTVIMYAFPSWQGGALRIVVPGLPIETGNDLLHPSTSRSAAASRRIFAASVAGM